MISNADCGIQRSQIFVVINILHVILGILYQRSPKSHILDFLQYEERE